MKALGLTRSETVKVLDSSIKGDGVNALSFDPASGVAKFKAAPVEITYDYASGLYSGSAPLYMSVILDWDAAATVSDDAVPDKPVSNDVVSEDPVPIVIISNDVIIPNIIISQEVVPNNVSSGDKVPANPASQDVTPNNVKPDDSEETSSSGGGCDMGVLAFSANLGCLAALALMALALKRGR